MLRLSPSLLSADFTRLKEQLAEVEAAGTQYLHLDVMDGVFVPNISFGVPVIQSIRKVSQMVFDVHLMIVEPERYINAFQKAGADIFNFHVEATKDPKAVIAAIREAGMQPAITLKPGTALSDILPYLSEVSMVLVMTVEPGFGGQSFMANQLSKIRELDRLRKEQGLLLDIEVDGGVTLQNIREVLDAGADVIVAGSAVFGQSDIRKAAEEFLQVFAEYEKA